jgi:hypothetical protein
MLRIAVAMIAVSRGQGSTVSNSRFLPRVPKFLFELAALLKWFNYSSSLRVCVFHRVSRWALDILNHWTERHSRCLHLFEDTFPNASVATKLGRPVCSQPCWNAGRSLEARVMWILWRGIHHTQDDCMQKLTPCDVFCPSNSGPLHPYASLAFYITAQSFASNWVAGIPAPSACLRLCWPTLSGWCMAKFWVKPFSF